MTTRPIYWSIRREFWENRSLYLAPLIVSGIALFGFLIHTLRLPKTMRAIASMSAEAQEAVLFKPYGLAASAILFTSIVVGAYYCLDALYGERRDRSILFWKSLPVSDRTTVLTKASIPLVVLPLMAFLLAHLAQFVMLGANTLVLLSNGINPARLWSRLPFLEGPLVMLYGLTAHMLWFAPIYCWLLLVSAWARRVPLLWAIGPFFALGLIERLAFGTQRVPEFLRYRFIGAMNEAFTVDAMKAPINRVYQLEPLQFLTSGGLWLGLAFAAICLAAAIRLRRNREPI